MSSAGGRRPVSAALVTLAVIGLAACGGGPGERAPAPPPKTPSVEEPPRPLAPAPWSAEPLSPDVVPSVYLEAWRAAENRDECALLAVEDPNVGGVRDHPEPRTARFAGGWAVAYDLPGLRSAFGVAGTGVRPGPDTYDDWPNRREWRDGSRVGWGPEGGSGPRQLAYLRVAGQGCLYNVWSRLGPDHLERLLDQLRRVEGAPPSPIGRLRR